MVVRVKDAGKFDIDVLATALAVRGGVSRGKPCLSIGCQLRPRDSHLLGRLAVLQTSVLPQEFESVRVEMLQIAY